MRFIDLFCGIGGFHLALAERGHKCVFASDIDRKAREAYYANFGLRPAGDITKIHEDEIPAHEILCGGFPCQAFSLANTAAKGMEEARGTLFFDVARIAKRRQPELLLLENVPRILTFDKGRVLATIKRTLDEIGYKLAWHRLNAAEYGCATARLRVYFVAVRKDLDWISRSPQDVGERDCIANHLREDLVDAGRDVFGKSKLEKPIEDYVFGHHPPQPMNPSGTKLVGRHRTASRLSAQGRRVYDPSGAFPAQCATRNEEKVLLPVRPKSIGMHKARNSTQGYRIYDPQLPGATLTANGGGQFAHTAGYLTSGRVRRLHIQEAKTIQGFPADHVLSPGEEGYRQLGNSVIPRMVGLVLDAVQKEGRPSQQA